MTNPVSDERSTAAAANRVTIVQYGTRQGHKSEVYLNWGIYGRPDEPIGMDYFFWLIESAAGTIVVDTGFSSEGGANRARTFLVHPTEALRALGVDPALVDTDRLLGVAADVAHQVARPAVPITMFIAGLAAAGVDPAPILARIEAEAGAWTVEQ